MCTSERQVRVRALTLTLTLLPQPPLSFACIIERGRKCAELCVCVLCMYVYVCVRARSVATEKALGIMSEYVAAEWITKLRRAMK